MRKHATDRLASTLAQNSALDLESGQAESGACRWESDIFQGSNSKSAYLSKLSNAVSQIKRASELEQLGVPTTAWVLDHQAIPPAASGQEVAGRECSPHQRIPTSQNNASPSGVTTCLPSQPSSSQQAVSEKKLRQLMQELNNASGTLLAPALMDV